MKIHYLKNLTFYLMFLLSQGLVNYGTQATSGPLPFIFYFLILFLIFIYDK